MCAFFAAAFTDESKGRPRRGRFSLVERVRQLETKMNDDDSFKSAIKKQMRRLSATKIQRKESITSETAEVLMTNLPYICDFHLRRNRLRVASP